VLRQSTFIVKVTFESVQTIEHSLLFPRQSAIFVKKPSRALIDPL
jgi:hypothetical protein